MCFVGSLVCEETLHVPWSSRHFNSHHMVLSAPYSFLSAISSNILKRTDPLAWNKEETRSRHASNPSSHMSTLGKRKKTHTVFVVVSH